MMLKNNIYSINKEFDYSTVKAIVVKSLEKIVKEEALNNTSDIIHDVEADSGDNHVKLSAPPSPELKLKIRNTTEYLTWRQR